ncbi:methyl-accepting chemotaxis protein [Loktanella salsilacus]|uniref:methyl-accepting chemotaxis protein n=1 Tax=Loktanella salsilacus TaxID=195913 RepID=UPI0037048E1A
MTEDTFGKEITKLSLFKGIRIRTMASYVVLIAFSIAIGVFSLTNIQSLSTNLQEINDVNSVKQRFAINFRGSVHDRAIEVRDVVLATDASQRENAKQQIKLLEKAYSNSAGPMDALFADDNPDTDTEMEILGRIKAVEARTIPLYESVLLAVEQGRLDEATTILMSEARPAFIDWLGVINEFIDYQEAQNQTIGAEVDGLVSGFSATMPVILAVAATAALGFMVWMGRTLSPLKTITRTIENMARGDLSVSPGKGGVGEIGELQAAAGTLIATLRQAETERAEMKQTEERAREETAEKYKAILKENEDAAKHQAELDRTLKEETEARTQQYQTLESQLSEVIGGAQAGDFSNRIETNFKEASLGELKSGVNMLMQSVEENLALAGKVLERVANGDLTQPMEGEFRGGFRHLQGSVNNMMDGLKSLIVEITGSGNTLASSSAELRDTSNALSKQAEQNAASLEETSAALEELTASVKQVNRNVEDASKNAQKARDTAHSSKQVASDAADAMESISGASKEITRVVGVIDDIAFQINLLALNAGVEAARAGEAGRGFSVVASEVRQLAQRAGEASKEISDVIARSDAAVSQGVEKVAGAKSSLETISESVIEISKAVVEISNAISEQVSGINEITAAVGQIDKSTQKQAGSFEGVTAASALLANEADVLKQSTAHFRTGQEANVVKMTKSTPVPSPSEAQRKVAASGGGNPARHIGWDEF